MDISQEYIVGKRYLIEHAFDVLRRRWVPILGPAHEDFDLVGTLDLHHHIDWRFVSDRICRQINSLPGDARPHLGNVVWLKNVEQPLKMRRVICRREMPEFPTYYRTEHQIPWLTQMENQYASMKINPKCAVCPHRGIKLSGMPTTNGVVVCPGHGLAWNMTTGELHRRVTA